MVAAAPTDADAAALPDGLSFCVEAALSVAPAHPPLSPPLLSVFCPAPSLSRSGSLHPASPQPAAATVAACLPASLALHLPVFLPLLSPALLSTQLWIMKFSVALQQFSHALQKKDST